MVYITRRERFNCAHRLFNPTFTDDENFALYGKCANPNWHGHNYELFITVKGKVNAETGMVLNLKSLSNVVNELVIDKMDHKNLNLEVDFMKGKITSSEVIVQSIWEVLSPAVIELGAELHKLKLTETENNYAEYYGE